MYFWLYEFLLFVTITFFSLFFFPLTMVFLFIHTFLFPQMPSVTVKDVNQQEFVRALSAFLKK